MFDKYVLVTGASSGIGRAILKKYVELGHTVIAVSRDYEKLVNQNFEYGSSVIPFSADLCELDSIEKLFFELKERKIKLDIIVHCAGVTVNSPLRANSPEEMERMFRINTGAFAEICRFASSKKYANNGASIVALSSTSSFVGCKGLSMYAASKAAINSLVKSFSIELSSREIRVNAIAPSYTETPMLDMTRNDIPDLDAMISNVQPFGIIDPNNLAEIVEFLTSEKARYITGAIIPVGAGNTCW